MVSIASCLYLLCQTKVNELIVIIISFVFEGTENGAEYSLSVAVSVPPSAHGGGGGFTAVAEISILVSRVYIPVLMNLCQCCL